MSNRGAWTLKHTIVDSIGTKWLIVPWLIVSSSAYALITLLVSTAPRVFNHSTHIQNARLTMPSLFSDIMDANPNSRNIFLLSGISTIIYYAIKLYPPLLAVGGLIILLGKNISVLPPKPKNIPLGAYITEMLIGCFFVRLMGKIFNSKATKPTKATVDIVIFLYFQSHFILTWYERIRARSTRIEEEKNRNKKGGVAREKVGPWSSIGMLSREKEANQTY